MPKPLNLALQGGGAHGAFTWGVLDTLLADEDLVFEGISGTSAGAMNALCVAHGLMSGGRAGARAALRDFWLAVAGSSPFPARSGKAAMLSPTVKLMLRWTDHLSPAQLNPLDIDPLRDLLEASFDFARLARESPVKLYIAATHANSGQLRIFQQRELCADVFLASACLPTIHRSVVIDGEPYWDGGYSANPAIFPLAYQCAAADILLVLLAPLRYAATPTTAPDIRERLRELAFSSTFLREMRAFAHLQANIAALATAAAPAPALGVIEQRLASLRFHAIGAEQTLASLPAESKLAVDVAFFEKLFADGQRHAQQWLAQNKASIGQTATLDLASAFY